MLLNGWPFGGPDSIVKFSDFDEMKIFFDWVHLESYLICENEEIVSWSLWEKENMLSSWCSLCCLQYETFRLKNKFFSRSLVNVEAAYSNLTEEMTKSHAHIQELAHKLSAQLAKNEDAEAKIQVYFKYYLIFLDMYI